jgi:hypothetical protein
MRHALAFALGTTLLLAAHAPGVAHAATQPPPGITPTFDPKDFTTSTRIDNPYFPLNPGTTFVYEGTPRGNGEHNEVSVTRDTKTILGVDCVVVHDRVWVKGDLVEDTFDWYAQDRAGNVWYMGEDASQYKNGALTGHEGSWEAGVGGAQPGYIMEAHPQVGDSYRQEFLAGVAEDMAQVLSVSESVSVPYGSWAGTVLRTKEWSPLERSVLEDKFYVPGIGTVRDDTLKGGSGGTQLVAIRAD